MKHKNICLILLLFQQSFMFAKFSLPKKITSFFNQNEPFQKIIQKNYKNIESVEITQTTGSISIETWKQPGVVLEIIHQGSETFIKDAQILVQNFHGKLVITNKLDGQSNDTTELRLIIPEAAPISINSKLGDINVSGSSGILELYVEDGTITIDNAINTINAKSSQGNVILWHKKIEPEKTITLTTENGDIFLYALDESNLDIDAQTLRGKINSTIPLTLHPLTLQINKKSIAELEQKISGFIGKPLFKTKLFCYTGNVYIESYN
jgi:hypothetical protein